MKKVLLLVFASFFCFYSFAQDRKIEIVCEVYGSQLSYAGMDKIFPDSLQHYFVKLDKRSRLTGLAVVNFLCLNGWSLVNYGDRREGVTSNPVYVLKRDIFLNDKDWQIISKKFSEWVL